MAETDTRNSLYMELIEGDEVMQDVRKRKADASADYLRFKGDIEGYHKFVEAQMNALGFRSVPNGNGTEHLVRIEP